MKKKSYLLLAATLLACCIAIVGCNQEDDDWDEMNVSLDVTSRTPMTKSNAMEPGVGANQGFNMNGNNSSPYTVPTYENECMLWAIITIATKKHIPIKERKGDTEYLKEIGKDNYSASNAYDYVKGLACGQKYNTYDEHGNSVPCTYNGGSMPESIAADIARESGIMEGTIVSFDTYDELYRYITNPAWSTKHPSGTYIISNKKEAHASVCNGVTGSGKIMLERNSDSDARQSGRYSQKNNENDGFILMF